MAKTKSHPQIQLIFPKKYDGVVEAVHYTRGGQIDWVRAYERRGPTWSDHVLLDRDKLVERLKAGKRFRVGSRQVFEASEFEVGAKLKLVKGHVVTEGSSSKNGDDLGSLPVI